MKNFINVAKTEEEQVESIKKWIKENAFSLIAGVIIGFGGIFGFDIYQNYIHSQNLEAREAFLSGKNGSNENYNIQNNLLTAKNNVATGDYAAAENALKSANTDNILQEVKNISLAKVYLEQQKFDEAINLLEGNKLDSSKHLLGDIYLAKGDKALALETYKLAETLTQNPQIKAIIDIKINNLK
jgi:predicted negative regulator of RcsB-dependent stress response